MDSTNRVPASILYCALLSLPGWTFAQQEVSAQKKADAQAPPAPAPFITQIKKAVAFIQADCKAPQGVESHVGTGFLVFFPEPRLGERGFTYLVTNRHVAQPGIEDSKPCEVTNYSVRVNLKANDKNGNASSQLFSIGASGIWFFPADDSVDLAVTAISGFSDKIFDVTQIAMNLFAEDGKGDFLEGDPVLFTGLFVQYMGQTRIQPIVRSGTLAMLPDEPITTTLRKLGHVYLAEVHAFGGNSGSPMFVDVGGLRKNTLGYNFKLLGVVSGEVNESANFELQVASSLKGSVTANSGVSTIVPAALLKALLQSPAIQAQRDAVVAKEK